jgi:hypothetical protein
VEIEGKYNGNWRKFNSGGTLQPIIDFRVGHSILIFRENIANYPIV